MSPGSSFWPFLPSGDFVVLGGVLVSVLAVVLAGVVAGSVAGGTVGAGMLGSGSGLEGSIEISPGLVVMATLFSVPKLCLVMALILRLLEGELGIEHSDGKATGVAKRKEGLIGK